MFTGIVEAVGHIAALQRGGGDVRIRIHTGKLNMRGARLGDSIAGNGVCLTAVAIADHGVSLTANAVDGACSEVNLAPHTLQETNLGGLAVGDAVNIEVDLVARYLARLLLGEAAARPAGAGLTRELLGRYGFINRGYWRSTPRPVIYPCHSAVSP